MKVVELLKLGGEMLKLMSKHEVNRDDWRFVPMYEEGYKKGYEEGYKDACEDCDKEMQGNEQYRRGRDSMGRFT